MQPVIKLAVNPNKPLTAVAARAPSAAVPLKTEHHESLMRQPPNAAKDRRPPAAIAMIIPHPRQKVTNRPQTTIRRVAAVIRRAIRAPVMTSRVRAPRIVRVHQGRRVLQIEKRNINQAAGTKIDS